MTDSKITHSKKRENIKYIMSNIINLCVNLLKEEDFYDPFMVDDKSVHPLSAKLGMKIFAYLKEIIKEIENSGFNNDNTPVIVKPAVNDNIEVINSIDVDDDSQEIVQIEVIKCKKEVVEETNQQPINNDEKLFIKRINQEGSSDCTDLVNTCTNYSEIIMPIRLVSVTESTKLVTTKRRNCPPAIPIRSFLNLSNKKSRIIQSQNGN